MNKKRTLFDSDHLVEFIKVRKHRDKRVRPKLERVGISKEDTGEVKQSLIHIFDINRSSKGGG